MLFTRSHGAKTLKKQTFILLRCCSHILMFSLPALRIEQSAGSDVPSGKTPPPQGFLVFFHLSPSSLPWSYHHLPHHDHHACYHNHHLNLERSFFCSFKIVAFYCVSPPSADIFSFVSFCTSFVIPPVNFNLSEYNNPPISNWSFAQWLIMLNFSCKLPVTKMIQSCIILLLLQFYITTTTCCIWIILNCSFAL